MASIRPAAFFENALYVGVNLQGVLYGIELVLYFKTMRIYLARRRNPRRCDVFYASFSTVMFLMVTIWVSIISMLGQDMWLDGTYAGGPMSFVSGGASRIMWDCAGAVTIVLQQMTNGLMVYRCRIVWDSLRVIILPSFLWLASLVLGIVAAAMTGPNPFAGVSSDLSLAFYATSALLSTTLTCMICYRLLRHASTLKECLGEQFASLYSTTVMFIVESVLPYTLTGIAFLVSLGLMNQVGMALWCVYTPMMCISPQMLILRVAEGNVWQTDTMKAPESVIKSCTGDGAMSSLRFNEEGAIVMHLETLSSVHRLGSDEDSDEV